MQWPNHDDAWRQWRDAIGGERMHHAWLLAGKQGLGKRDFAEAAARELVALDGAEHGGATHPDVLILTHLPKDEKEERKRDDGKPFELKRNLPVGQIRAMQQRLTTKPTLGSRRVVIITPADDMERQASNALLKSLEEPPAGTYFMLVTHRPARLLPTIRSRCRTLRFPEMSPGAIAEALAAQDNSGDAASRDAAVAASGGSLGAAKTFLDMELAPVADVMHALLEQGDPRLELRGRLVTAIGPRPQRDRIMAVLNLARALLGQTMHERAAAGSSAQSLIEAHGALVTLAGQAPTYNFDNGLLVGEIARLLASAAPASEPAHG